MTALRQLHSSPNDMVRSLGGRYGMPQAFDSTADHVCLAPRSEAYAGYTIDSTEIFDTPKAEPSHSTKDQLAGRVNDFQIVSIGLKYVGLCDWSIMILRRYCR